MMLAEFELLLKRTMGLDAASIGSSTIERAVQARLAACHLEDVPAYWQRVCESSAELHELIEAVVVPETWFFRDTEAFRALARIAQAEWLPTESAGVLRLLSLPCSTGEEPYSMAMALIEAGLPGRRFRVDALDISSRALARAQLAVYGTNSFRGIDLGFRDRHFEATPDGYRLADTVRQQVRFQQGNFFDEGLLPGENLHDIIFCRNVLIYFDRATQDRAIKVLARLLAPTGYLFVGPSETGVLLAHDFAPVRIPLAFAFRKVGAAPGEPHLHGAQRAPLDRPPAPSARPPTPPRPVRAQAPAPHHNRLPAAPVTPAVGLDEAARLADEGRLSEAAKQCERDLRAHGPSARAFYLLGLVRDSAGDQPEAVECYRKALYLDPVHREALVHLSRLLDKQGDKAGARVLNDRARRLEQTHRAT